MRIQATYSKRMKRESSFSNSSKRRRDSGSKRDSKLMKDSKHQSSLTQTRNKITDQAKRGEIKIETTEIIEKEEVAMQGREEEDRIIETTTIETKEIAIEEEVISQGINKSINLKARMRREDKKRGEIEKLKVREETMMDKEEEEEVKEGEEDTEEMVKAIEEVEVAKEDQAEAGVTMNTITETKKKRIGTTQAQILWKVRTWKTTMITINLLYLNPILIANHLDASKMMKRTKVKKEMETVDIVEEEAVEEEAGEAVVVAKTEVAIITRRTPT